MSSSPKTSDALSWRNRLPFQLSLLAIRLMDASGQRAMTEVIRQGSRAVNRAHYQSRYVDRSRLGLGPRTTEEHPGATEPRTAPDARGDLPKTTDACTRRNRLPMHLSHQALKLMDKSGQRAMAAVITAGARSVNDAWRAERNRKADEMLASGRLNLRARHPLPTNAIEENR